MLLWEKGYTEESDLAGLSSTVNSSHSAHLTVPHIAVPSLTRYRGGSVAMPTGGTVNLRLTPAKREG